MKLSKIEAEEFDWDAAEQPVARAKPAPRAITPEPAAHVAPTHQDVARERFAMVKQEFAESDAHALLWRHHEPEAAEEMVEGLLLRLFGPAAYQREAGKVYFFLHGECWVDAFKKAILRRRLDDRANLDPKGNAPAFRQHGDAFVSDDGLTEVHVERFSRLMSWRPVAFAEVGIWGGKEVDVLFLMGVLPHLRGKNKGPLRIAYIDNGSNCYPSLEYKIIHA